MMEVVKWVGNSRAAFKQWARNSPHTKVVLYITIYVICGTGLSLLIRSADERKKGTTDPKFPFNPASVVLAIEFIKLLLASAFYFNWRDEHTFEYKAANLLKYNSLAFLYVTPAFFYSAYNVFMFYTIALVGPASFRVLINIRVIFAGLFLQYFGLSPVLSIRQWSGLALLVAACVLEQWGHYDPFSGSLLGIAFVLIMSWCSGMAGVVNQLLLQRRPTQETTGRFVWQSNIYLYAWSCVLQFCYLYLFDRAALSPHAFFSFDARVCGMIALASIVGFSTAFLLADTSILVKEYANFLDMLLTVILNRLVFSSPPLHWTMGAGLCLVTLSLYLYYYSSNGTFVVMHSPQCSPMSSLPVTNLTTLQLTNSNANSSAHHFHSPSLSPAVSGLPGSSAGGGSGMSSLPLGNSAGDIGTGSSGGSGGGGSGSHSIHMDGSASGDGAGGVSGVMISRSLRKSIDARTHAAHAAAAASAVANLSTGGESPVLTPVSILGSITGNSGGGGLITPSDSPIVTAQHRLVMSTSASTPVNSHHRG